MRVSLLFAVCFSVVVIAHLLRISVVLIAIVSTMLMLCFLSWLLYCLCAFVFLLSVCFAARVLFILSFLAAVGF